MAYDRQVSFKWSEGAEAALDAALRKRAARTGEKETRAEFARRVTLEAIMVDLGPNTFHDLVLDEAEREDVKPLARQMNEALHPN